MSDLTAEQIAAVFRESYARAWHDLEGEPRDEVLVALDDMAGRFSIALDLGDVVASREWRQSTLGPMSLGSAVTLDSDGEAVPQKEHGERAVDPRTIDAGREQQTTIYDMGA